ncbi:hypothetical protein L218DRAFT_887262 [Marasmius fiardii PR-910]|nr:hypothetical protein L218DRAFT_887262 [Marasmius fiardii PR-910]
MKKLKLRTPNYGGAVNIDLFDQFTFDFDYLMYIYQLDDYTAIRVMPNYLFDKVHRFIQDNIGPKAHSWTVALVYTALFEYCFPPTFKENLCEELMTSKQGTHTIEEFEADLRTGARRFGDVPEHMMVQTLWKGVKQHIQVYWHSKGLSPEDSVNDVVSSKL